MAVEEEEEEEEVLTRSGERPIPRSCLTLF